MQNITNLGSVDVLVVGGGLAAMYAAIEASKSNLNIALISKKLIGRSGASVVSLSVHRYSADEFNEKIAYKDKFLKGGRFINDENLVDIFIEQGASRVEVLPQFGIGLNFKEINISDNYYRNVASCKPKKGRYLTVPALGYVRKQSNIKLLEGYMAIQLVIRDNRVCGILLEKDNQIYFVGSKSIVLATGGAGYIYSHTSNTSDLTGDGYAAALRANLPLQDMEFVQFYPYRICYPVQHDIFPDIFKYGARFVNETGYRFMEKYNNKELENRDFLSREMFAQKEVYLDLENCDKQFLKEECDNLYDMYYRFKDKKFKVQPVTHFMMGGISIKGDCSTDIQGLFCCGEVTGGLHGANRLAGHALTETAVFGPIAGKSAANFAQNNPSSQMSPQIDWVPELGGDKAESIVKNLRETMWQNVGIVRSGSTLKRAKTEIDELLYQLKSYKPQELRSWIECLNMLEVSKGLIQACIKREESRGSHFRSDFPDESNSWLGNIILRDGDVTFNKKISIN